MKGTNLPSGGLAALYLVVAKTVDGRGYLVPQHGRN